MTLIQPTRRDFLTSGSAALAWALPHTASNASTVTPLEFMIVGDWGRDGAYYQRQVATAMGQFRRSQFVVSTGDNFYQHGVGSIHDRKWDTSFQRIYSAVPQRWYAVLGNHDYAGSVEAQMNLL